MVQRIHRVAVHHHMKKASKKKKNKRASPVALLLQENDDRMKGHLLYSAADDAKVVSDVEAVQRARMAVSKLRRQGVQQRKQLRTQMAATTHGVARAVNGATRMRQEALHQLKIRKRRARRELIKALKAGQDSPMGRA